MARTFVRNNSSNLLQNSRGPKRHAMTKRRNHQRSRTLQRTVLSNFNRLDIEIDGFDLELEISQKPKRNHNFCIDPCICCRSHRDGYVFWGG